MIYIVIALVSFLASLLTFFSGFGLGTILLPVFALFFDLPTSVLLTAIVHFLNNIFKFFLVGKHINRRVFLVFSIPSFIAAFAGALLLERLAGLAPLFSYTIAGHQFTISGIGLTIGFLMVLFAFWEIIPFLKNISFSENKLVAGGIISGFFGGLSGHQGAMRSAFLVRLNLQKEAFLATGIAIACLVDMARMSVYAQNISVDLISSNSLLLLCAVGSAWGGAFTGNKLLKKTTYAFIKWFVLVFMLAIAVLVAAGILTK